MPKLAHRSMCTGCTACASVCAKQCIKMKVDNDGFVYPELEDSAACIECGVCEKICPILNSVDKRENDPIAYAAFSKNEELRRESSSGGVFSEIAQMVFEKNGVVYGATYNDKFEVYHCQIDNLSDLYKIQGAKYSESNLGNSFVDILKQLVQGRYVMFVGTPCQVAGLKAFVKREYDNLFCIDFICHSIPSPMVWQRYIEFRAKEDADGELPMSIKLRSKETGWSNYQYSNVFQYQSGKRHSIVSSQSLFMNLFVNDYIARPSCDSCQFKGYKRVSDITLGDFWGIWDIAPEMDDNKGTSVVLLQSDKGRMFWDRISDRIVFKEVTLKQVSEQNKSILVASKANHKREDVLDRIRNGEIGSCTGLFVSQKCSLIEITKRNLIKLFRWGALTVQKIGTKE